MIRIAVAGGGLSGLAAAYALLSRNDNLQVVVFESDARAGGKIWSDKTDGFLCEKGANGFLDNKPMTLELCKELGISPLRSNENSKKRFIYSGGKLNALPDSPPAFLKSGFLSWKGKLRLALDLIAPKGPDDETVADFVIRRLGKEALERLIDPMCSGIFAGDPYKMSIKHCFPRIKELEQEYGSLIRAMLKLQKAKKKTEAEKMRSCEDKNFSTSQPLNSSTSQSNVSPAPSGTLTSFHDGAQTITDALKEKLNGRVTLGVSAHGIEKKGNLYQLHTSQGIVNADAVILATPAYASAEILKDFDRALSQTLSGIPYAPVAVVCFGYRRDKVVHDLNGFGFLIPHIENRNILGTLWDSSIFPNRAPEGHILLRTMTGGAKSPHLASLNDNVLINTVFDELKPLISLKEEPSLVRIYRWEKAIPQYVIGHGDRLRLIDERLKSHPNLYLTGNAYKGVGMNDCIENACKLADEIVMKITG
ncbi:MAG: protoporphyrinogen oxidase [Nitrospirae bacterium]|nr:protoporphyrinogen oxidase [Nitrospirota bacterium]